MAGISYEVPGHRSYSRGLVDGTECQSLRRGTLGLFEFSETLYSASEDLVENTACATRSLPRRDAPIVLRPGRAPRP